MNKDVVLKGSNFDWSTIEGAYNRLTTQEYRKSKGQYFTPDDISIFLAKFLNLKENQVILDPSCGLGKFPWAVNEVVGSETSLSVDCFELDDKISLELDKNLKNLNREGFNILNQDFLRTRYECIYDSVICNPPYTIYKEYPIPSDILQEYSIKIGEKLSPMTNIYNIFLLKGIEAVKEKGRLAYIIPKEFLSTDYGVPLKKFLKKIGYDLTIIFFDTSLNLFEGAITTSCLFLMTKTKSKSFRVGIVKTEKDWESLIDGSENDDFYLSYNYKDVDEKKKWHNLTNREVLEHNFDQKIGDIFKCSRGVATGANKYFVLNKERAGELGIGSNYYVPCITKSNQIKKLLLDESDVSRLIDGGGEVLLLDIREGDLDKSDGLNSYIESGLEDGIDQKYLPAHRTPWYRTENIKSGEILIGTFFRGEVKAIRNLAGVANLTCYHGMHLKKKLSKLQIDSVCAYLQSDICNKLAMLEVRKLGGGLNKLEPKDVEKIPCPNFLKFNKTSLEAMSGIFYELSSNLINKKDYNYRLKKVLEEEGVTISF
jgi:adenine-specific DNA-methyltransferase